jgi:hypothetical protein
VSDVHDWRCQVPIARIQVLEGRYDGQRLGHVSKLYRLR